jgi:GNAT superfamily N-acetyltransferase
VTRVREYCGEVYRTEELTRRTWPDFEQLFSRGNGWDFCWCIAFHRVPRPSREIFRTRAEVSVQNHRAKRALLEQGHAHGILVYADDEPVGWCQYGTSDELLARKGAPQPRERSWRITCFVVDRRFRRKGVAAIALHTALESIRTQGGGLVEAFPVVCWSMGPGGSAKSIEVPGVGAVGPAHGGFNNVSTSGVMSMFSKEGFVPVATCGSTSTRIRDSGALGDHVVMHKRL